MNTTPAIESALTEQERQLIEVYRNISDQGKQMLMQTTEMVSKTYPGNTVIFPWWKSMLEGGDQA